MCTPELLKQALDLPRVAKVCAEIEDALEACRRGEICREEFETEKGKLKKRLPVLTPHATFKEGRRVNSQAVPSGLAIYDKDHIEDPMGWWAQVEPKKKELGILLAHITPSKEGCRLMFVIPKGMDLPQSQAWMAEQLGDKVYDACVKDYARCSFIVPRDYVLYLDEEGLFAPPSPCHPGTPSSCHPGTPSPCHPEQSEGSVTQTWVQTMTRQGKGMTRQGERNLW